MWYGSAAQVPRGWNLCDGNGGRPDLRNRFIPGAGARLNPDETGGSLTHTHAFTTDAHQHNILAGAEIESGEEFYDDATGNQVDTGITDAGSTLPPYYSLYYIMKN